MEQVKLDRILRWCRGTVVDRKILKSYCTGISTDTRTIRNGELFIAIKGENFDGHNFLDAALRKGAAAVVSADENAVTNGRTIVVRDTQKALGDIAAGYRRQFSAYVIGITGSDGKTTTKEFLKKTLSLKYSVKGTEGNLNNQLGLPLSIFSMDRKTDFCVLEMGMNRRNELRFLGKIARPHAGVITNVASAHLGFFRSGLEIAEAKSELIETLAGEKLCLLNYDNKFFPFLKKKAHRCKTLSFGLRKGAETRGILMEEGNDFFNFGIEGTHHVFRINFWNISMIYPALVAFAFGNRFRIGPEKIADVFAGISPLPGRGLVRKAGGITVIDETYNANPNSMKAALQNLSRKRFRRKIAVLGDMAELGRFSSLFHRNTGLSARNLDVDILVTFGSESRLISETSGKEYRHFKDVDRINRYLSGIAKRGDVFLVKGSRIMRMERIVNHLCS